MQVFVRDNNVDQALRALKKKLQREGVFREMKLRKHYEKPSETTVREKAEAVRAKTCPQEIAAGGTSATVQTSGRANGRGKGGSLAGSSLWVLMQHSRKSS